VDDETFTAYVAGRLAELPAVRVVSLGGSRAEGTHRPDSDWDFSLYYRGHFNPQALRDIGWPGEVSEIGGWGGGVFNGGAWLEIDGRRTDVHYRDLNTVEAEIEASREGRFRIEPLMFHLAGIPSYLVLAELSVKRVLHGELPTPDYPAALRGAAARVWWDRAIPRRACVRSTPTSPPRGRTPPSCAPSWTDPAPPVRMPYSRPIARTMRSRRCSCPGPRTGRTVPTRHRVAPPPR
jgi:predicted nucleotidyltransferase